MDEERDKRFDAEVTEMLGGVERRVSEQEARAQASGAFGMLLLMGDLDFSRLNADLKERYIRDVFKFCCYAIAGAPVVQSAILAANPGFQSTEAVAAIVDVLAPLFGTDPAPVLAKMLGAELLETGRGG